jgi:hypothetical protein
VHNDTIHIAYNNKDLEESSVHSFLADRDTFHPKIKSTPRRAKAQVVL